MSKYKQSTSPSPTVHLEDATLARLEMVRQTLGTPSNRPHYDLVIQKLLKLWENEHDHK